MLPTTAAQVRARPIREVHFEPAPGEIGGRTRSLIPMKPSGTTRPVFVIHGVFGQIFHFKRMTEVIREDIPIYGLEARGVRDDGPTHSSVPEMARAYIEEIRSVQPDGPYLIAGFSFGVHVGLEIAWQLDQEGVVVRFLAIDAGLPEAHAPTTPVKLPRMRRWGRIAAFHWKNWRGLEGKAKPSYARETFRSETQRFLRFLRLDDKGFFYRQTLKIGRQPQRGQTSVVRKGIAAMDSWDYQTYRHPFTLFRAKLQNPEFEERPTLGFTPENAPGGVDIRHLPGQHAFMFVPPHVFTLAAEFEDWVDRQMALETDEAVESVEAALSDRSDRSGSDADSDATIATDLGAIPTEG